MLCRVMLRHAVSTQGALLLHCCAVLHARTYGGVHAVPSPMPYYSSPACCALWRQGRREGEGEACR